MHVLFFLKYHNKPWQKFLPNGCIAFVFTRPVGKLFQRAASLEKKDENFSLVEKADNAI